MMQSSHARTNRELNDTGLSLLRLLEPGICADPYALYRASREFESVHWEPYMTRG